ncbi:hypothetical protein NQZ79_g6674 [Umbelopsis isabellina]|nr:hypothetical protein NQZ79_g6674 [Umbelopsis isabellina]
MSSSTGSSNHNQAIESLFRYYARLFTINETFMSHGLTLLSRRINLEESTFERIVFRQPLHVVHMSNCRNIVYLKIWHDVNQAVEGNSLTTLQVPLGAKMYAGQTENPRTRDSNLQPYLRELGLPQIHICIGHNLNVYQRDALETATIAWCMFLHGLALLNRSPFGNHFYRNVQANVAVDMITEEHYTSVGAFHHWRLAIIIGTAPSRTVFESFVYQNQHLTEQVPFIDWTVFLSWGGLSRFRVLIGQTNPPPFIDHWPGEECVLIDDWLRGKNLEQIEEADVALKRRMGAARKFLGVMLGARPTRLTPGQQVEKYLTTTCGTLTFSNLQGDYKVVFLWLPHPAVYRYIQLKHYYVLEQLYICASQAIATIELKLFSMGVTASSAGILSNQVEELRDWWIDHPYSKVLRCLSDNISTIMASYHISVDIPPVSTNILNQTSVDTETAGLLSLLPPRSTRLDELWYSLNVIKITNNSENPSEIFNARLQVQEEGSQANIEGTMLFTLNKRFDSFIRKKALHNSNEFDLLTTDEQASILQRQVSEPDEAEIVAMDRCRAEFFHQRSRVPTTAGQVLSTCLTCNDHLPRRDVTGRITIKVEHGCSCGRTSFTSGWHFLPITADPGTYPANNLFVKHIQTLPTPLVINHRQLQASLVQFLQESDQRDPQLMILRDRYQPLFENFLSFRPQDSAQRNSLSRFSISFNDTYRKLEQLAFNVDIGISLDFRIISRQPLPIERAAFASSVSRTMHVFAFGYPEEFQATESMLLSEENLDYMNYRELLSVVADERRATRRARTR